MFSIFVVVRYFQGAFIYRLPHLRFQRFISESIVATLSSSPASTVVHSICYSTYKCFQIMQDSHVSLRHFHSLLDHFSCDRLPILITKFISTFLFCHAPVSIISPHMKKLLTPPSMGLKDRNSQYSLHNCGLINLFIVTPCYKYVSQLL